MAAVRQVNVLMNLGVADYNGLQTNFSYRGNSRMYAAVSYTLSKATNTTKRTATASTRTRASSPARRGRTRTELVDQRHRAVITFSYRFPFNITAAP